MKEVIQWEKGRKLKKWLKRRKISTQLSATPYLPLIWSIQLFNAFKYVRILKLYNRNAKFNRQWMKMNFLKQNNCIHAITQMIRDLKLKAAYVLKVFVKKRKISVTNKWREKWKPFCEYILIGWDVLITILAVSYCFLSFQSLESVESLKQRKICKSSATNIFRLVTFRRLDIQIFIVRNEELKNFFLKTNKMKWRHTQFWAGLHWECWTWPFTLIQTYHKIQFYSLAQ